MPQTSKDIIVKKLFNINQATGIKEYLEEAEFLKKARSDAESLKIPIVDDQTGRFLELACILLKPSKILEIGCGTGYSTYFLLKSIFQELTAGLSIGGSGSIGESCGINERAAKQPDIKAQEPAAGFEKTNNSKRPFSYTGIDLNRERLGQACLLISGLINKTILPCQDGRRLKTFIECESFSCSFEFIHGNAVKIIREEPETPEKYDLVFIDAAKYQYPDYLEALRDRMAAGCAIIADNIFYNGKIFKEETLKHDTNSVAGLTEYLRVINGEDAFKTSLFNIGDGIALSIYNIDK